MRYRPFAHHDMSVSAVSLALTDDFGPRSADAWTELVVAALEAGINAFEIQGRHPAIGQGLAQALTAVERRLLLAGLRVGPRTIPAQYEAQAFQPHIIQAAVQSALTRTRLGYLDLLLLDDPGDADLPPQSLTLLKDLKARGTIRYIGIAGEGESIDAYISTGAFDALALPFNMTSGWRSRLRLREAQAREMAVIGYAPCPIALQPKISPPAKRGLWRRRPEHQADPYGFLGATPGWTVEEICLAFALTEPSLASVQIVAEDIKRVRSMAAAADRDLPAGLAAQIEMARIDPAARQSA